MMAAEQGSVANLGARGEVGARHARVVVAEGVAARALLEPEVAPEDEHTGDVLEIKHGPVSVRVREGVVREEQAVVKPQHALA
jgi:hypothetical protein